MSEGRDPLDVVLHLSENTRLELLDGILGACWFDGNAPTERREMLRQRSLAWLQGNVSTTCGHSARKLLERLNATLASDFLEVASLLRRLLALAVVRQLARGKEGRSLDIRTIWPVLFPYTPVLGLAEMPELLQLALPARQRLLHALHVSIQRHEDVFGPIETDVQKRVQKKETN